MAAILFDFFVNVVAAALATTTLTNTSTRLRMDMTSATGVQTVVLPASNNYRGKVCCVHVVNAVATHTVDVKAVSGGATIDQFAATVNGSRLYTWNGTTWVSCFDPS